MQIRDLFPDVQRIKINAPSIASTEFGFVVELANARGIKFSLGVIYLHPEAVDESNHVPGAVTTARGLYEF